MRDVLKLHFSQPQTAPGELSVSVMIAAESRRVLFVVHPRELGSVAQVFQRDMGKNG